MEHDIPFGNSNRENGPTFLDFPLCLGIFQWDEPTKRVPFTAGPEIPVILTTWKAPCVARVWNREGTDKLVNGKQHSVWFVRTGMKGLPQNALLNFRLEFPKSDLTIYLPSGISEIFCQMVRYQFFRPFDFVTKPSVVTRARSRWRTVKTSSSDLAKYRER